MRRHRTPEQKRHPPCRSPFAPSFPKMPQSSAPGFRPPRHSPNGVDQGSVFRSMRRNSRRCALQPWTFHRRAGCFPALSMAILPATPRWRSTGKMASAASAASRSIRGSKDKASPNHSWSALSSGSSQRFTSRGWNSTSTPSIRPRSEPISNSVLSRKACGGRPPGSEISDGTPPSMACFAAISRQKGRFRTAARRSFPQAQSPQHANA